MRCSCLATRRRVALIGAISLLAAFLGGGLAAAEPSEAPNEVADSLGFETETDDDDALRSQVRSSSRAGRSCFLTVSHGASAAMLGHAPLARAPPSPE